VRSARAAAIAKRTVSDGRARIGFLGGEPRDGAAG
jgi:hypothetical protein